MQELFWLEHRIPEFRFWKDFVFGTSKIVQRARGHDAFIILMYSYVSYYVALIFTSRTLR